MVTRIGTYYRYLHDTFYGFYKVSPNDVIHTSLKFLARCGSDFTDATETQ